MTLAALPLKPKHNAHTVVPCGLCKEVLRLIYMKLVSKMDRFLQQDPIITEAILREVVERMGKDFNEAASSFLGFPAGDRHLAMMARASKELEHEQLDYDSLIDGNPSPSLRDQEYLQHRLSSTYKLTISPCQHTHGRR